MCLDLTSAYAFKLTHAVTAFTFILYVAHNGGLLVLSHNWAGIENCIFVVFRYSVTVWITWWFMVHFYNCVFPSQWNFLYLLQQAYITTSEAIKIFLMGVWCNKIWILYGWIPFWHPSHEAHLVVITCDLWRLGFVLLLAAYLSHCAADSVGQARPPRSSHLHKSCGGPEVFPSQRKDIISPVYHGCVQGDILN